MNNPFSTPLTEYLNQQQVAYRLLPHQTPATTIEDAAIQRGIQTQQMVKSILLRDMGDLYALACVPGNQSVDPKKARAILNYRRMTCVSLTDVPNITGYQIGCVAPLLLLNSMPILMDRKIANQSEVTISSGNNMAGIALSSADLIRLCQPTLMDLCRD